jgi:hypothetical protein
MTCHGKAYQYAYGSMSAGFAVGTLVVNKRYLLSGYPASRFMLAGPKGWKV